MNEEEQAMMPVTKEVVQQLTIARLATEVTELREFLALYQRKVAELEAKVQSLTDVSNKQEV